MKSVPYRSVMVVIVLVAALSVSVTGCFGFGGDSATTKTTRATDSSGGSSHATTTLPGDTVVAENDELSTFRSKDPFVPQAQPATTAGIPEEGTTVSTSGGSSGGTVSTISKPNIPSTVTTISSGGPGTTTVSTTPTPTSSTTTTAPRVHTLRVLSASQVGGAAAVTFQVDGSVYRDKRVGDVVSTSWGQIKVVDINTSSRVVTLLQGSETLVLSVGQSIYQ
jgi:hypothetical protein